MLSPLHAQKSLQVKKGFQIKIRFKEKSLQVKKGLQVKIRFNHDKYTIMDIINRISNYCKITDMHIEEQGLEEILKEIYRGEITC